MYQRGLFADVVKFYTRGQQNFFKFAFENKKKTESDYNAFVRENMINGCYLVKDVIDDPTFPKVGSFIMTKGSISSAFYDYAQDGDMVGVTIPVDPSSIQQIGTIAGMSAALKAWNPAIQDGDIVTLTTIVSEAFFDNAFPMTSYMESDASLGHEPTWQIKQFIVDTTDTRALTTIGLGANAGTTSVDLMNTTADATDARNLIAASCLVISRNTPTGLKVTTSQLALSYGARRVIARTGAGAGYLEDSYRDLYLKSWGTSEKVILQGSLAKAKQDIVIAHVDNVFDVDSSTFDEAVEYTKTEDPVEMPANISIDELNVDKFISVSGRNLMLIETSDFTTSKSNLVIRDVTPISDTVAIITIRVTSDYSGNASIDYLGDTAFNVAFVG